MDVVAFIRKRGNSYYLVHNVRRDGRVQQIHLACLGRRPLINEDVIQGVVAKHPFVRVDWDGLKERASRESVKPAENGSEFLRQLITQVRDCHLNIADLQLPWLEIIRERELKTQLLTELKLLRGTLDVKLNSSRKGGFLNLREKPY
ncbi:MAG: hypothetical protein ACRD2B_10130 [Terriglobia bacterium]